MFEEAWVHSYLSKHLCNEFNTHLSGTFFYLLFMKYNQVWLLICAYEYFPKENEKHNHSNRHNDGSLTCTNVLCTHAAESQLRSWFVHYSPNVVKSRTGSEASGATQSSSRWRWPGVLSSSARQCFNRQLLHHHKPHNKYKMGGCTVISNISVKIKVKADLLYMHLYIYRLWVSFRCKHIQMPEIIPLHSLCSLYAIL